MLTNRVQRTRFLGIETKFFELGLQAQKLSPKDSVSFSLPVAHQPTQKISYRVSKIHSEHSHSLSLSVSLSLFDSLLSLSLSLTLTLLLHRRLAQSLIPSHSSRSVAVAVAVAASRSRPSVSASLNLSPSMVGSNYLTKVRTLFFLGLLVMDDWHALIDFF